MSNKIIRAILEKFLYNKELKYNEIWDKKICSSSHFDYYFKKLIDQGIVEKDDEVYKLTPKGEKYIFQFDAETIENEEKPIVCAFVYAFDEDKILLTKRVKQPFYGYYVVVGGKVDLGETTLECAKREFFEKTNLTCEPELSQIIEKRTYDEETGMVTHHMIGYFYKTNKVEGNFRDASREGEHKWVTLDEMKGLRHFPENDILIPQLLEGKRVRTYVVERWKKDDEIVRFEIKE